MTLESSNGPLFPTQSAMKPLQNGHQHQSLPLNDSCATNDQSKAHTSALRRRERTDSESQLQDKPLLQLFPIISSAAVDRQSEQNQNQSDVNYNVSNNLAQLDVNGHLSSSHSSPSSSSSTYYDEHEHEHDDEHDNGILVNNDANQNPKLVNTTRSSSSSQLRHSNRVQRIASAVRTILDCLDEDPCRSGLQKTPERYAKALLSLTEGYSQTPEQVVNNAKFEETPSESVIVRNIDVFSLCEHHLLPFHGWCHVAYIPNTHVIGLSKVARIVNMYARRLQVQERLTAQIADAILQVTQAHGVMVQICCTHMCMSMRGVQKVSAQTSTTATRGQYAKDPHLRLEFISTISRTNP